MNVSAIVLVGLLAAVAQTAVAPRLAVFDAAPDGLLVLTVFLALYGRRGEALVCGWTLGLLADFLSIERPGVLSAGYALAALAASAMRDAVYLRSAATHCVVTILIGVMLHAGLAVRHWTHHSASATTIAQTLLSDAVRVVLSGIWAVPINAVLLTLAPILGLRAVRRFPRSNRRPSRVSRV